MPVHPIGEPEEVWMERGRKMIEVQGEPPTEEQLLEAKANTASLTPAEARKGLSNLLFRASAHQSGEVTTVKVYGALSWAVQIDGWPIGRIPGGRGKMTRASALVREHYQTRRARMEALDHRLSVGERPEFLAAEAALDQLTPPEAHRLITLYLAKLERRSR